MKNAKADGEFGRNEIGGESDQGGGGKDLYGAEERVAEKDRKVSAEELLLGKGKGKTDQEKESKCGQAGQNN